MISLGGFCMINEKVHFNKHREYFPNNKEVVVLEKDIFVREIVSNSRCNKQT